MKAGGNDSKEPWFYSRPVRWGLTAVVVMYAALFPFYLFRDSRQGSNVPPSNGQSLAGRLMRPLAAAAWARKPAGASGVNHAPAPGAPAGAAAAKPPLSGVYRYSPVVEKIDGGPFAELFTAYAEKHRKLQEAVVQGRAPLKRAIIAHCGRNQVCAGHGDRAFGILVLYLAAIFTDRAFFIDMSKPLPMERYVVPNKLPWRISDIKDSALRDKVTQCAGSKPGVFRECNFYDILLPGGQCNHIMGLVFSDREFIVVNSDHRTECVGKILAKQGVVPPKGQHGFNGTEADLRTWAANVSHIMSSWLYRFEDKIVAAATKALVPVGGTAPVPPECLLCIHVRSGSGVGERERHTNWPDFASCGMAADAFLAKSKTCPRPPTWLIVGDNSKAAEEIFRHVTLAQKPTVLTTNGLGGPTHLDQNNGASDDMVAHVFVDWFLLSRCRVLVASLSTFGATASIMGGPAVERFDMEVKNHANGCRHHRISDWQRDANIPG